MKSVLSLLLGLFSVSVSLPVHGATIAETLAGVSPILTRLFLMRLRRVTWRLSSYSYRRVCRLIPVYYDGWTAPHVAALGGSGAVVESLVARGMDVNAKTDDGWTAPHVAAEYGRLAVVKYLAKQKASIEARDNDSRTPRDLAESFSHTDVMEYLESVGGVGSGASSVVHAGDGYVVEVALSAAESGIGSGPVGRGW